MKKSFYYLTFCFVLLAGTANASFPVSKDSKAVQTELAQAADYQAAMEMQASIENAQMEQASMEESASDDDLKRMSDEEFWITLALWFFLGGFAAHRWYRGKPVGWNILFILTAGGCGIWAIVDLVNILQRKF